MSRRNKPTIHGPKKSSRSMIESLEIPNTYASRPQSRTGTIHIPCSSAREPLTQTESPPRSETLSIACSYQELFCTTDSCTNSQNCLKTFPDICPHGLKKENEDGHCSDICHTIHNSSYNCDIQPSISGCGQSTSSVKITTIRDSPSLAGLCSSCFNLKRSRTLVKNHSCSKTQTVKNNKSEKNTVGFAPDKRSHRSSSPIHDPDQQENDYTEYRKDASCCPKLSSTPSQTSGGNYPSIPEKHYKSTGVQTDERIQFCPASNVLPKTETDNSDQNAVNTMLVDKIMSCCEESEALLQAREKELQNAEARQQSFADTGTHVSPDTKAAGTGTAKTTQRDSTNATTDLIEEPTKSPPRLSLTKKECMDCCAQLEATRSRPNLLSSVRIPEDKPDTAVKDSSFKEEEDTDKEGTETKNDPSSCVEKMFAPPVQKKCSCHFPPAFKQYGCTGNIAGNCNCASSD